MASRSGGTPIRTRKVKPGPDQAFTLPKGTSAAPIKQVKIATKTKKKKKYKDTALYKEHKRIREKLGLDKPEVKKGINPYDLAAWKQGQKYDLKKSKKNKGGLVNSRTIAKKYFRGGMV